MSLMLCATLCRTIVHATMCQLSRIGSIFGLIYRIFTTYIWDVSSHIVNVMLYCLTCLSFFKYRFDGFRPLSMCSRPYIFVFEIIGIPASFSFPKISYRFRFQWKNIKVKMMESFADHFRPFSSLMIDTPNIWVFILGTQKHHMNLTTKTNSCTNMFLVFFF